MTAVDFPTRMFVLATTLERSPADALPLAAALERDLLAAETTDPAEFGWVRDYHIRALYRLGRDAEGVAMLMTPPPRAMTISTKNAAWLHSAGAEMALRSGSSAQVRALIGRALALRIAGDDAEGCRMAVGTGFALLLRVGDPHELDAWLEHVEAQIEAAQGRELAGEMAEALAEVARAPGLLEVLPSGERRGDEWALHRAALDGQLEEVRRLLAAGVAIDARHPAWPGLPTALLAASFRGHAAIVEELLARGAEVRGANVQGRTALHLAADQEHALIVAMLCDAGAPVDALDFHLHSPLHVAAWQDHRESARVLLAAGAATELRDVNGDTPLALAATEPVPEVVRALCLAGAQVEAVNACGQTPLMRAAMAGQADTATVLLEVGADPSIRDHAGRTALDWARAEEHRAAASLLRRHLRVVRG
ncbi:ankyrin repeat domain-containing protein [Nannocystis bainbridge]|uniref:Ankyrin repeat domain-containing protein n=1 Tax=Nannocystis bainbridge TaxID=2995303 RepID=A0ABT5EBP8_9BACT|nr:ankyrin repeat domain-containing protein [Nannocystis bainbridge]MDC0723295.1 ankyrin repeat domain-containing protein [Nannocystis bainbridge]